MKINQKTKIPAHQKNVHEYSVKASTLVDILRGRMKVKQDFLIFMDMKNHEKKISAAEVVARSEMTAQYLMAQGLRKDDKVVIMLPTGEEFVYVYFGTLMAGGVPVPVSQPAGTSNLEKYLEI